MFSVDRPFREVVELDHECFPEIVSSLVNILYMGEPGIADRTEARSVLLSLKPPLIALSIHFLRPYDNPRNTEPIDCPYQLCAGPFPVGCNPEVQELSEANIVIGVVELGFEVDQVNVHLHGYLQTKEGLLIIEQPFFYNFEHSILIFCVL